MIFLTSIILAFALFQSIRSDDVKVDIKEPGLKLVKAAWQGDQQRLIEVITLTNVKLDETFPGSEPFCNTPAVVLAAQSNCQVCLREIVVNGGNVHQVRPSDNATALSEASRLGHSYIVDLLIEMKFDDSALKTALLEAAKAGDASVDTLKHEEYLRIIAILTDKGANVADCYSFTTCQEFINGKLNQLALSAVRNRNLEELDRLRNAPGIDNFSGLADKLLQVAIEQSYEQAVLYILDKRFAVDRDKALTLAIPKGLAMVKIIVENTEANGTCETCKCFLTPCNLQKQIEACESFRKAVLTSNLEILTYLTPRMFITPLEEGFYAMHLGDCVTLNATWAFDYLLTLQYADIVNERYWDQLLSSIIEKGRLHMIDSISVKVDIDQSTNFHGESALIQAIKTKNPQTVSSILKYASGNKTAVIAAVDSGSPEVLKVIKHCGKVNLEYCCEYKNCFDSSNQTVREICENVKLAKAVVAEDLDEIAEIVPQRVPPNFCYFNKSAVIEAVVSNKFESFKKLIELEFSFGDNRCGSLAIAKAIELGRVNFVKKMLENNPELVKFVDERGDDLMVMAGKAKHLGFLKLLHEDYGFPTTRCRVEACLQWLGLERFEELNKGIKSNNSYIVSQIVNDKSLDLLSYPTLNAFYEVMKTGNMDLIGPFIDSGIVKHLEESPISLAIELRKQSLVETLINKGVDVNFVDYSSRTLLMRAAMYGQLRAIKVLMEAGVNCSLGDKKSRTAIMHAARSGHMEAVKLLINCQASEVVNRVISVSLDYDGTTQKSRNESALTLVAEYGEKLKFPWERKHAIETLTELLRVAKDGTDCQEFAICQEAIRNV